MSTLHDAAPADSLQVAWRELLVQGADKPWLLKLLAERGTALVARYATWRHRLGRLRRGERRRLQRNLGVGLAGVALLLALSARPAVQAGGVVGTGTPASARMRRWTRRWPARGAVTFNCGSAAHTITVGATKTITANTTIDGGGLITLSGGGARRVITVNAGFSLTLNSATISGGSASFGGGIANFGTLTVQNSTLSGNLANSAAAAASGTPVR